MNAGVNLEQARAWNGNEGDSWTSHEESFNASTRRHTERLRLAAAVATDDDVLDIGCGCGQTTRMFAQLAPRGTALGVDLSAPMLERARERSAAAGIANVRFEQADAQVHPFAPGAFSVAVSRFGVMFFDDPVAAFTNVRRALRPDGRLAFVAWQELARNEWLLSIRGALAAGRELPSPPAGMPGPFGLADPDAVRTILTDAGFTDINVADIKEPVELGVDTEHAYTFVSGIGVTQGMLQDLDDAAREQALTELRAMLAAHEASEGVLLGSHAWLVTATNT
jgi:SAM-dependent methyltransferase